MSNTPPVTKVTHHMPHGDLHPHTSHAHQFTTPTHTPHTSATAHDTQIHIHSISSIQAPNMTPAAIDATQTPSNEHGPDPTTLYGYTTLPLPELAPTDLRLFSHNINTLHTLTSAKLGATFDSYETFQPTIIGLQETNKNWSLYDKTEGPLQTIINQ